MSSNSLAVYVYSLEPFVWFLISFVLFTALQALG